MDNPQVPRPYVYVTLDGPDDGGDFGPHTPATKTSGIQEALDYAHAQGRDVHIWGGRGGLHKGQGVAHNIYTLDETLRIPWSQDFNLSGGNYLLSYRPARGHAVHIDSQMNCRYKLGLIGSSSPDAVVTLRPQTPGPDDFVAITGSVFDFSAICSHHPEGTGLLLDAAQGPIINSRIFAEETNTEGTGVRLSDAGGAGQWISNNHIQVMYGNQYHAKGHCTGLRLGDPGSRKIVHNRLELSFHAPRGAQFDPREKAYVTAPDFVPEEAIGARIYAQHNTLTLSSFGSRQPGHDIVFEAEARDNAIYALNLPNGITNKAAIPTSKIIPNGPVGFEISTPSVPAAGEVLTNAHPYSVQIFILTPGRISAWTITEAARAPQPVPHNLSLVDNLRHPPRPAPPPPAALSQTICAGLYPGQTFILEPGDKIRLDYTEAPTWRWKALS